MINMKGADFVMFDDKEENNMTNDNSTSNTPFSTGTSNGYGGQPLGYGSSAYSNNAYLESMYGNSSAGNVNNVESTDNDDDDIVFISNDEPDVSDEARNILDGFDNNNDTKNSDVNDILKNLDFPEEKISYTNNTENIIPQPQLQPQQASYNSEIKADEPYMAQPQPQQTSYNGGIKADEPYMAQPQQASYNSGIKADEPYMAQPQQASYNSGIKVDEPYMAQPQQASYNSGIKVDEPYMAQPQQASYNSGIKVDEPYMAQPQQPQSQSTNNSRIVVNAPYGGTSNVNYEVSEVSKYSSTSGTMYESGSSESGNGTAAYSAPFKRDNSFNSGDLGGMNIGGDAVDMTAPNYGSRNNSFGSGNYNTVNSGGHSGSVITKITGFLVIMAMIGLVGFFLYLYKLGSFDIMAYKSTYAIAGGVFDGIMLLDGLVMAISNGDVTLVIFALILPVFYPVKRCYTTYGRKNLHWLWLLLVFVLGGFVFTNIYPQVRQEVLLVKNSADVYSSDCDDAVRYLKSIKVNSDQALRAGIKSDKDKMIVEIVREVYNDYTFDAKKLSSNTYQITVKGDTKVELKAEKVSAYQLMKDNTVITFTVSCNAEGSYVLSNNIKVAIVTNGGTREFAVSAFNEICQSDDK